MSWLGVGIVITVCDIIQFASLRPATKISFLGAIVALNDVNTPSYRVLETISRTSPLKSTVPICNAQLMHFFPLLDFCIQFIYCIYRLLRDSYPLKNEATFHSKQNNLFPQIQERRVVPQNDWIKNGEVRIPVTCQKNFVCSFLCATATCNGILCAVVWVYIINFH